MWISKAAIFEMASKDSCNPKKKQTEKENCRQSSKTPPSLDLISGQKHFTKTTGQTVSKTFPALVRHAVYAWLTLNTQQQRSLEMASV